VHTQDAVEAPKYSSADQQLALNLAAAIRTAAYYDPHNEVMQRVCSSLIGSLKERAQDEGKIRVGVHSHCVFVGGARVRTTVSTYERFAYLIQLFETRGINAVIFQFELSESDLVIFLKVMAVEHREGAPDISAQLQAAGVSTIEIDDSLVREGQSIAPVETFAAAVQAGAELRERSETGQPANVRQIRHVTQSVVDQMMSDPQSLVALTTVKELDGWLISHSINVAILAVLMGQRLGLSKSRLGELCLAGFLHDIGKREISPDILHKPGPLTGEEWAEMKNHPVFAARALLRTGRLNVPSMRSVVVAYEHHMNFDLSGYPAAKHKESVSLYGNIVTIADQYDALTTARPYRTSNFTPHEALAYLLMHSGRYYDPTLVKLFVEIMGLYPPGTVLSLSDGEVGVVFEPPVVGEPLDRPKVRLLGSRRYGEVVDLAEQMDGHYSITVSNVLNPANMGQVPAMDLSLFDLD
jgi:HD-GYP domain-containing protein (c-di-GMP phosphodiesterase class II)